MRKVAMGKQGKITKNKTNKFAGPMAPGVSDYGEIHMMSEFIHLNGRSCGPPRGSLAPKLLLLTGVARSYFFLFFVYFL